MVRIRRTFGREELRELQRRELPVDVLSALLFLLLVAGCCALPDDLELSYAQGELGNGFRCEDEREHHLVGLALVWHLRPAPVYLAEPACRVHRPERTGLLPAPSSPLPPPGGDSGGVEETTPRAADSSTPSSTPGATPRPAPAASSLTVDDSTTGASDLVHAPAASWSALALELAGEHQLEGLIGLICLAIATEILRRLGVIRVPGLPDRRPGKGGNPPTNEPPPG